MDTKTACGHVRHVTRLLCLVIMQGGAVSRDSAEVFFLIVHT